MNGFIFKIFCKQRISKALLIATLFLSTLSAFASNDSTLTPVSVTLEKSGSHLVVSTTNEQWQVSLERYSLLGNSAAIQRALYDLPFFYKGQILDKKDSWVRISSDIDLSLSSKTTLDSLNISGHIFVNNEMFELQNNITSGHTLVAIAGSSESIRSLKTSFNSAQKNFSDLLGIEAKATPLKAIKIGIMSDSRYNDIHNGRGLAEAYKIISGVDGLFQSQLGLAIIVEASNLEDNPQTDPLRNYSGDMVQMLNEFRHIRRSYEQFPADLALVHLFTGHSDPTDLIGVGWINTVCQLDGYDVSISSHYPNSLLLSAHEIAHNLGALHDDDRQCSAYSSITGSEVMWSELSDTTQNSFSSCSLDIMRESLSSSCVQENIDMALAIKSTPTSFLLEQQIEVSALNWDSIRTSGRVSSVTRFPASTHLSNQPAGCVKKNTTLTCQHGHIGALSQTTYSFTALFANAQSTEISSELLLSDFTDLENENNAASINASLTDIVTNQPQSANILASNNVVNSGVTSGGSSGLGSTGALGLFCLSLLFFATRLNRRTA